MMTHKTEAGKAATAYLMQMRLGKPNAQQRAFFSGSLNAGSPLFEVTLPLGVFRAERYTFPWIIEDFSNWEARPYLTPEEMTFAKTSHLVCYRAEVGRNERQRHSLLLAEMHRGFNFPVYEVLKADLHRETLILTQRGDLDPIETADQEFAAFREADIEGLLLSFGKLSSGISTSSKNPAGRNTAADITRKDVTRLLLESDMPEDDVLATLRNPYTYGMNPIYGGFFQLPERYRVSMTPVGGNLNFFEVDPHRPESLPGKEAGVSFKAARKRGRNFFDTKLEFVENDILGRYNIQGIYPEEGNIKLQPTMTQRPNSDFQIFPPAVIDAGLPTFTEKELTRMVVRSKEAARVLNQNDPMRGMV